jgi:hypothetical protein
MKTSSFHLLAVGLCVAGIAHAQSVLISDLGDPTGGANDQILNRTGSHGSNSGIADSFTVGAGDFSLTSIGIDISGGSGTLPVFGLYSDSSGTPGSLIATLSLTGGFSAGVNVFTPSTSVTLLANTTYWWVGEEQTISNASYTIPIANGGAATTGEPDWTIGGIEQNQSSGAFGAPGSYETEFDVVGTEMSAVPEPSTYALIAGVAALGFAVYRRRGLSV